MLDCVVTQENKAPLEELLRAIRAAPQGTPFAHRLRRRASMSVEPDSAPLWIEAKLYSDVRAATQRTRASQVLFWAHPCACAG